MRHLLLGILILIPATASTFAMASAAALVTMQAEGSLGEIDKIYQDGVFSGLASDVIEITKGEAQFNLEFDGGYNVSVAALVEGDGLKVSAPVFRDQSQSRWIKEVSAPIAVKIEQDRTLDALFSIKLDVPDLRDTDQPRTFVVPLMFAPNEEAAIVSFKSDPPGAEIWIDGERLKFATDVTLSIPFLTYDDINYETKSVVLRMPGHVNVRREISLANQTLSVALETPEAWYARNSGRLAP